MGDWLSMHAPEQETQWEGKEERKMRREEEVEENGGGGGW